MSVMADSASEMESDTSSIDGAPTMKMTSPAQIEQLEKRLESLQQENRVLKMELESFKAKCKSLQEENRELRKASVNIQAKAEQEEEFISNTLLKEIHALKKEKERLAMNYEQEEEYLTNDLSRKLCKLRQEKVELEETLEKEQEVQINKLMKKIEKLEADTVSKQQTLEQLRREKVELENSLEQEQESLVNRLWKRMDRLEAEKRLLQEKLDQPVSAPPSPRDISTARNGDTARNLAQHIDNLRAEVSGLKGQLRAGQIEHAEKMAQFAQEERHIREENVRLQRRLQLEMERRENLCRHLSESESSLEMDDERHFNEMSKQHEVGSVVRPRTVSSPIPYGQTRPMSPAGTYVAARSPPSPMRRSFPGQGFQAPLQPPQYQPSSSYPSSQGAVSHPPGPQGNFTGHHPSAFLPGTSPPVFSSLPPGPALQKPKAGTKFTKPTTTPSDKT